MAERSQIREMIFLEGALAVFPPAAAAFLLPQAGGVLICLAVSRMLGIPFFYKLHLAEILIQAGFLARQRKLHPWRQTAFILFAVLVSTVCGDGQSGLCVC